MNDKTSIPEAYHILIMPSTSRSLHTALRSPPPTHDYQRDGSYIPSMYYPRCCYVLAVQTQGLTFTRTSPAFGGCTSIVSMLSGLPASQATAARQETTCRVTRTLHRVQQTKPDSHAGSWPSLCIRTYTFPTVWAMLRSAPRPHVYTSLIMRQRNSFHKINEQSYDDDDDDDIAGAVFHLDRWAFLNLANSLLRSIST